ncbi:MAG: tetratricopeptide repeat protein [Planctomycetota bacterium]|jgi:tetratricopeptide (TPR) repeat protein
MMHRPHPSWFLLPVLALAATAFAKPIGVAEIDPLDKALYKKLYEAQVMRERQLEDVIKEYARRAEEKAPARAQAIHRFLYGKLLLMTGQRDEAVEQWRSALRLFAEFPACHVALGNVALMNGDRKSAGREARRALKIDREYLRAYLLLASIAQAEDKWLKALGYYQRAAEIDSSSPHALRGLCLANVQLFKDSYDDARRKKYADRAAEIANIWVSMVPEDPEPRIFESVVYFELGKLDVAAKKLEQTLVEVRDLTEAQQKLCLGRIFLVRAQMGNLEGAKDALQRILKLQSLDGKERAEFQDRLADLERRGLDARIFWEIDRWIAVLDNRGISATQRREAMRKVLGMLSDDRTIADPRFKEIVDKAFRTAVKTLKDAPPELSIDIMQFFRRRMPDPLLVRIIVHFVYPAGIERKVTEAVRVEATRSLAEVGGPAALPSLLYTLADDSLAVSRAIDVALCEITERRSAIEPGAGPVTKAEQGILRRSWREWSETEAGSVALVAAIAKLDKAISGNARFNRNQRRNPVGEHVITVVLLNPDMKWEAWKAAYDFIKRYFAKDFLPPELRGKEVTPDLRKVVVDEIDAWFAGGATNEEEADDLSAKKPPKEDDEDDKSDTEGK